MVGVSREWWSGQGSRPPRTGSFSARVGIGIESCVAVAPGLQDLASTLNDPAAQAAVDAAKAAEKQREEALVERRAAAKARVDSTEEAAGPAAKRVRVRLPAGPPLARAFREGDAISVVRDFVDASGRAPRNFALVYAGPPKRTLGDDDAPLSSLGPGPVALMVADLDA